MLALFCLHATLYSTRLLPQLVVLTALVMLRVSAVARVLARVLSTEDEVEVYLASKTQNGVLDASDEANKYELPIGHILETVADQY